MGPVWFRRVAWWVVWVGGVVSTIVFGYFTRTADPAWAVGVSQRVHIVGVSVWIFCLGLFSAQSFEPWTEPDPGSTSA